MKKLITLFVIIIILSANLTAETYYTCSTSGQNTTNPNGTTGCSASTAWNTAGDTLIVRNGTTFNITSDITLTGVLFIAQGGTVNIDDATLFGSTTVNINGPAGALIVNGDLNINDNLDCTFNVNSGGYFEVGTTGVVTNNSNNFFGASGEIIFNTGSNSVINGSVTSSEDVTINGTVTGSGSINSQNGGISGSGTVNGQSAPFSNPMDVGATGFTWNGSAWSPSVPTQITDRVIFAGNYTDNGTDVFGAATINSGVSVTFIDRQNINNIRNNGTLTLEDNCTLANDVVFDGTGTMTLKRNFSNVGWKHISWPVKSGSYTLSSLTVTDNKVPFNYTSPKTDQTNVFVWNASTTGWEVPTASTSIVGQPINMFVFKATASVSLTINTADFNVADFNQNYVTVMGGTDPGNAKPGSGWGVGSAEGWNMFVNPFQSYLTIADLDFLGGNFSGSVYVFDAASGSYKAGNFGGGASETVIAPNQAFFVQSTAGSGSATIPAIAANAASAATPNYLKTSNEKEQVVLQLSGEGHTLNTYIAHHDFATTGFDSEYDAYYLRGNAPVFNTVGKDSVAYILNQMPNVLDEELYVSFSHKENGKTFTISADDESVEKYNHVVLKDLHTGKIVDLKEQDYTFSSDQSAPVQRFKVILSNSYIVPVEVTSDNLNIWFSGNAMQLDPRVEANVKSISVYNMAGQLVSTGSKAADIKVDDFGVFVVQILTNTGDVLNQKVAK